MNRNEYTADQFIKDEYFQQWVYSPDPDSDLFWSSFLRENPSKKAAMDEARLFLLVFTSREDEILKSRISNLKSRIDQAIDKESDRGVNVASPLPSEDEIVVERETRKPFPWRWAVAASLVLLVASASYFMMPVDSIQNLAFSDQQEQITQKGQHSVITLEDGTKVWLNADSRLEYPKTFSDKSVREVYLDGEGFFKVTRNEKKPFVVKTAGIDIKVLGTSFNVKSYREDKRIETTLVEGKVAIKSHKDDRELFLLPDQHAVFEKETGELKLQELSTEKATGWKEGKLDFEDVALHDILVSLERWFNVSIHLDKDVSASCTFSAKVDNKTLDEVLELFRESTDITYEVKGQDVYIHGDLCTE